MYVGSFWCAPGVEHHWRSLKHHNCWLIPLLRVEQYFTAALSVNAYLDCFHLALVICISNSFSGFCTLSIFLPLRINPCRSATFFLIWVTGYFSIELLSINLLKQLKWWKVKDVVTIYKSSCTKRFFNSLHGNSCKKSINHECDNAKMTLVQNKPVKVDFRTVFNKKRAPRDSLITVISLGSFMAFIFIAFI